MTPRHRVQAARHADDDIPFGKRSKASWLKGYVRSRAIKLSRAFGIGTDVPSGGFQDGQHGGGATEEMQSAMVGRHVLVKAGTRAEEVAQFVVAATEPGG